MIGFCLEEGSLGTVSTSARIKVCMICQRKFKSQVASRRVFPKNYDYSCCIGCNREAGKADQLETQSPVSSPDHQVNVVLLYPLTPWEEEGTSKSPERHCCCRCKSFVGIKSRTFEYYQRPYMAGWRVFEEHYRCVRCGFESKPKKRPRRLMDS